MDKVYLTADVVNLILVSKALADNGTVCASVKDNLVRVTIEKKDYKRRAYSFSA